MGSVRSAVRHCSRSARANRSELADRDSPPSGGAEQFPRVVHERGAAPDSPKRRWAGGGNAGILTIPSPRTARRSETPVPHAPDAGDEAALDTCAAPWVTTSTRCKLSAGEGDRVKGDGLPCKQTSTITGPTRRPALLVRRRRSAGPTRQPPSSSATTGARKRLNFR